MWVWRDDAALGRGTGSAGVDVTTPGWRLDAYGTWTWSEPSPLERSGAGVGALRSGFASEASSRVAPEPARAVPAARSAEPVMAGTPIFQALTEDRSRRSMLHAVPEPDDRSVPTVPEPHPGSGPLPVQDAGGLTRARRGLADVPTVPPPPGPGSGGAAADESPEDELRRRAERRRRPRAEPEVATGRGRHALREPQVTGGRHTMR